MATGRCQIARHALERCRWRAGHRAAPDSLGAQHPDFYQVQQRVIAWQCKMYRSESAYLKIRIPSDKVRILK